MSDSNQPPQSAQPATQGSAKLGPTSLIQQRLDAIARRIEGLQREPDPDGPSESPTSDAESSSTPPAAWAAALSAETREPAADYAAESTEPPPVADPSAEPPESSDDSAPGRDATSPAHENAQFADADPAPDEASEQFDVALQQAPPGELDWSGEIAPEDEDFQASEAGSLTVHAGIGSDELKSRTIMIVDDEPINIMTVQRHLENRGYRSFLSTSDPRQVIAMLKQNLPDLLLLDIRMPHVSGLDILRLMMLDNELMRIPVLILTASTDPEVKRQALGLGATDFLMKPVDTNDLVPRVRNALVVKTHYDHMATQAQQLEELVRRRTEELVQSRQQLILSLARAAEHRDNETSNHVIRVGMYAGIVARELNWSEEDIEMIQQAAQLHDVGKIGVPDSILFKPGKLDPQEYECIKKHCALGKEIISPFSERDFQVWKTHVRMGENILHVRSSPMLMMAARIAQTHHERWDGTGYPLGLSGEDIPIEGRIVAVADVYDALSSKRPYKKAMPREKCWRIMEEGRDRHFDGRVLDAFFARAEEVIQTQLDYMDVEE